jgi:hypothetical protein
MAPVIFEGAVDVPPKYKPEAHFKAVGALLGQARGSVVAAWMVRPRTVPWTVKRY